MRTRSSPLSSAAALNGIWAILLLAFVVAALYFGRAVFVPLALATLITFLFSRFVARVERWIGRIAAVLVMVALMFSIFAAASWLIGRQVVDLRLVHEAQRLHELHAGVPADVGGEALRADPRDAFGRRGVERQRHRGRRDGGAPPRARLPRVDQGSIRIECRRVCISATDFRGESGDQFASIIRRVPSTSRIQNSSVRPGSPL